VYDWESSAGADLCSLQPCLYTDVDGNPTCYASGRPAGHVGGDASLDTTGRWLNEDGSSSYPGASGLLDAGWEGPSCFGRLEDCLARGGRASDHLVGAFFYDPDLAKFGNAFSPFVEASSYEAAQLALQRPFEDRYNPRYERQTWADFMGMDNYEDDEFVGADPGHTCWTDPDTGVISMFPSGAAAKKAAAMHARDKLGPLLRDQSWFRGIGVGCSLEAPCVKVNVRDITDEVLAAIPASVEGVAVYVDAVGDIKALSSVSGFFDSLSDKTGFKKGTIAAALGIGGLTAILMSRNPRHALEIAAAGAAGIVGSFALDMGSRTKE
jgi:hypothetical protein